MSLIDQLTKAEFPDFGIQYVSLQHIKDKPTEANPSPIRMILWSEHEARIKELETALLQAKFDIQYLYNNTDKHVAIKRIDQAINETTKT